MLQSVVRALMFLAVLAFPFATLAQDVFHVRLGATGSGDGSDWANAYPSIPSTLKRGATYYLADGNYARQEFDTPAAADKEITIKKATAAEHGAEAGWQPAFGDGVAELTAIAFDSERWVLDGGKREKLAEGGGLRVFNNSDKCTLVTLSKRAHRITLRYVELAGDPSYENRVTGISGLKEPFFVTVQHCYLHDFFGVPFHLSDATQVVIEHCLIARNKSTPQWHSEGIMARGCTGLIVRNCRWEDIEGTAVIVSGSGKSSGWRIQGNVFLRGNVGHGIVADNQVDSIEDVEVSGNIIVGHRGNAGMNFHKSKGRISVSGNVWYDNPWVSFTGVTSRDHNYYSSCRFPLAFQPALSETAARVGKDGKYSTPTAAPFVDVARGDFTLAREVLQTITKDKGL
jgi:hypothetical protein